MLRHVWRGGWVQLVVVFDADMVCVPEFYTRVLGELADPQVALVLSPQKFHNYDMDTDIFNHSNLIYWQISLPGLDGWDNVSCTGTNFIVRAQAAAQVRCCLSAGHIVISLLIFHILHPTPAQRRGPKLLMEAASQAKATIVYIWEGLRGSSLVLHRLDGSQHTR